MSPFRKLISFAALLFLLLGGVTDIVQARPAYCDVALQGCYSDCDSIFGWPLNYACRYGCMLGYENCGNPA